MDLLRRDPELRRLWLARLGSFLGDSLGLVALILYVSGETGGVAAVGLLLLAGDFAPALLSPLLGTIADRTEGRRTTVACEIGRAGAVGLIVVGVDDVACRSWAPTRMCGPRPVGLHLPHDPHAASACGALTVTFAG